MATLSPNDFSGALAPRGLGVRPFGWAYQGTVNLPISRSRINLALLDAML